MKFLRVAMSAIAMFTILFVAGAAFAVESGTLTASTTKITLGDSVSFDVTWPENLVTDKTYMVCSVYRDTTDGSVARSERLFRCSKEKSSFSWTFDVSHFAANDTRKVWGTLYADSASATARVEPIAETNNVEITIGNGYIPVEPSPPPTDGSGNSGDSSSSGGGCSGFNMGAAILTLGLSGLMFSHRD